MLISFEMPKKGLIVSCSMHTPTTTIRPSRRRRRPDQLNELVRFSVVSHAYQNTRWTWSLRRCLARLRRLALLALVAQSFPLLATVAST